MGLTMVDCMHGECLRAFMNLPWLDKRPAAGNNVIPGINWETEHRLGYTIPAEARPSRAQCFSQSREEYLRNIDTKYHTHIQQVVFEGKQDPEYWPERLPQQDAAGKHLREGYLIHVDAARPTSSSLKREQACAKVDTLTTEQPTAEVRQSYPKSPRPTGMADPGVQAQWKSRSEARKAIKNAAEKPFIRPEKSLREQGLI